MRQGQQSRRGRNRGRKPQNSISRNYESSGPDVKIRGTAMHIAEKYTSLAWDAMSSGDSVAAENYLQHAEHYNRIILAAQAQNGPMGEMDLPSMNGSRFDRQEFHNDHDHDDDAVEDTGEFLPQQTPRFLERPVYNQNQPQPFIPQNAFPQVQPQLQPAPAAQNGTAPFPAEGFAPGQEGAAAPRRRRRRPMNEPHGGKTFNGRHSGGAAPAANGTAAAGGDPAPDEAAS